MKFVQRDLGKAAEASSGGGDRGLAKEIITLGALTTVALGILYLVVVAVTDAVVARITPQEEQELFRYATRGLFEYHQVPEAFQEKFAMCERVLRKLRSYEEAAQLDYRIAYVEQPAPNAFAVPGGTIGVTRGLLDALDNEIGFAFVIAHELGHFAHRDHLRGLGRKIGFNAGTRLLLGGGLDGFSQGTSELVAAKYSRTTESGADDFAIRAVLAIYGETEGAEALFRVLDEQESAPKWAYMFSTHPDNQSRIRRILRAKQKTED